LLFVKTPSSKGAASFFVQLHLLLKAWIQWRFPPVVKGSGARAATSSLLPNIFLSSCYSSLTFIYERL